jgi:hypothetical protein
MIDNNSCLNSVSNSQAKVLQELLTFKKEEDLSIMVLLKKIPLLSGVLRNLNQAGNAVNRLVRIAGSKLEMLETLGTGFQYVGIALNALDFLRIPFIYLASLYFHKNPPVTLSKNVRWFYSAVVLSLTIIAVALPVVALPMALALAALPVAFTIITMAKTLYKRYKVPKELKAVSEKINEITKDLLSLKDETIRLEAVFHQAKLSGLDTSTIQQSLDRVSQQFNQLIAEKEPILRELSDQKFKCKAVLAKHSSDAVMDKGVGLAVAAIILAGVTLSLFFPPLGLGIVAGGAMIGVAYIIIRMAFPLMKHLFAKKQVETYIADGSESPSVDSPSVIALKLMADVPMETALPKVLETQFIELTTAQVRLPAPKEVTPSFSVDVGTRHSSASFA